MTSASIMEDKNFVLNNIHTLLRDLMQLYLAHILPYSIRLLGDTVHRQKKQNENKNKRKLHVIIIYSAAKVTVFYLNIIAQIIEKA
ncbi:MAG TPA: hypothetical protein DCG33_02155 [Prevotellaceae bacterium]|nr:hypothetical protein [Prevotellaceae bacterium]